MFNLGKRQWCSVNTKCMYAYFSSCKVRCIVRNYEICCCTSSAASAAFRLRGQVCPITHTGNQAPSFISVYKTAWEQQTVLQLRMRWCQVVPRGLNICHRHPKKSYWNIIRTHRKRRHWCTSKPLPLWTWHTPTHAHMRRSGVVWLKLVWKQCRGGRMTSRHPAEEHVPQTWTPFKHTDEHTNTRSTYIYICAQSFPCTLNISSLEITLAVLRRQQSCYVCFYEGAVSQWLAWIQAHFDRIWGLRLNMLNKRRTYPTSYL